MIIAVDFDGTIVEERYPFIGAEKPHAIAVLKKLKAEGHKLILWTVREGKLLDDAVNYCRSRGLEFYAVNANSPTEKIGDKFYSRKLRATIFIDDRILHDLPSWTDIYQLVQDHIAKRERQNSEEESEEKKSIWKRLLGMF